MNSNIIHSQTSYTYTTKLHYTLIKKKVTLHRTRQYIKIIQLATNPSSPTPATPLPETTKSYLPFKNLCTFMMHDHTGCTWLYLTHHLKNPIPHVGSLNISNLTHLPWHHFILISYTYASCITYQYIIFVSAYTSHIHSQMENDISKHNSFTNILHIHN